MMTQQVYQKNTAPHPEDLKARLRKAGITLVSLAKEMGVTPSAVSRSLRTKVSRRIDETIAAALGKRPEDIWPDRYPRKAA